MKPSGEMQDFSGTLYYEPKEPPTRLAQMDPGSENGEKETARNWPKSETVSLKRSRPR